MKEPAITFTTTKTKPLAEVTAADIPRGLSAEDVATDCAPVVESLVVDSGTCKFTIGPKVYEGDLCDLYTCEYKTPEGSQTALYKVVLSAKDNDLLENEAKTLRLLYPASAKDEKFYRYLPKLVSSFRHEGKQANVLPWFSEYISLTDIIQAYPKGIDFRDMVWMFKRILVGIGFAHSKDFIHGAIIPQHVLVHPTEHGAKLVGWSYAVGITPVPKAVPVGKPVAKTIWDRLDDEDLLEDPTPPHIKAISGEYRHFYPPEVFKKVTPTFETDIFMAAKCAVALLGGDVLTNRMPDSVPRSIQRFLSNCLFDTPSKRPSSAWDLHEALDKVLYDIIGKPKYRPFTMP